MHDPEKTWPGFGHSQIKNANALSKAFGLNNPSEIKEIVKVITISNTDDTTIASVPVIRGKYFLALLLHMFAVTHSNPFRLNTMMMRILKEYFTERVFNDASSNPNTRNGRLRTLILNPDVVIKIEYHQ